MKQELSTRRGRRRRRAFTLFISLLLLLSLSSLSPVTSTHPQQGDGEPFKYRFIRRASTWAANENGSGEYDYDYIVVGGGTAGCPLAATLSTKYKVLLLERGGVPFHNINVSYLQNFHISLADTSPESASQMFVSTDGVFNSRARVLGGATCINAGFYTRASPSYIRRAGWDPRLVNESYPWIEKQIVQRPRLAPWQRAVRDGLLEVGISPDNGFTFDHKYGTKVGGTIFDEDGRRHTAAELLASGHPNNLDVLVHAKVQKIVFDRRGKKPRAAGVIFKDENGDLHRVYLSRRRGSEIIVSCGAIGSPQMLLLSGVGPKSDLKKLNISLILDNKFVGTGMADNPLNSVFIPTSKRVKQSLIQTVGITKEGVYVEASSGFGQSPDSIRCHHGIASAEIGQLSTIPPKQRTKEAIQAFKERKKDLPFEAFMGGFILEKVAKPKSKGELKLNTLNVDENPSVTFNYFSHPDDVRRCVEGIRIIEKVVKSKHFANFTQCSKETMERILNMSVQANVNLLPKHSNDTRCLEQFCKDTVTTIWHYHGGCQVGKVVDKSYRVLGIDRLRVIDGSTYRESPGTNPQATVLMLGRYMGVKMLRERLGRRAGV